MAVSQSSVSHSQQAGKVRELSDETKRIEETLQVTSCVRSELIDATTSVLQRIMARTQLIEQESYRRESWSMETSIKEAISQVEVYVEEARDALIRALFNQDTESGSWHKVEIKLCFLSIALDELQNRISGISGNSFESLPETDLDGLTILQSLN